MRLAIFICSRWMDASKIFVDPKSKIDISTLLRTKYR